MKKTYVRKSYTPIQLAYLAGIIDGEGSIYIGRFKRNDKRHIDHYQTNITICNTERSLTDWLYETFGGSLSEYTPNLHNRNYSSCAVSPSPRD
jgi:hypothetical protein